VAPDTIARVKDERIATVKLLTLEKLATALEVDVHDLFEYVRTSPSSFER
jgi:DNA-binding Xre family transcriptional regulator